MTHRVTELHCIMPIGNIPSVMQHGILSRNLRRKKKIPNHSVALQGVQELRSRKVVLRARPLHDYANLYFDAHNPMLSRVREYNNEICVLRISPEVLNLPKVAISDRNAACDFVGFYPYPYGLEKLDFDMVYATWWKHRDDPRLEELHRHIKCAEVLVPDCVEPQYIIGAYVCNRGAKKVLKDAGFSGKIRIKNSGLFF